MIVFLVYGVSQAADVAITIIISLYGRAVYVVYHFVAVTAVCGLVCV